MAWIEGLGLNEWIAIGSAALAVLSFLFNWAVVSRQTAMQAEGLKAQVDADLLAWAHEAIDAVSVGIRIARGRGAAYGAEETRLMALETGAKLSSLADRGRLFFPNFAHADHGSEKEAAFQGFRPPILDAVVFAAQQVDRIDARNLGPDTEAADVLLRCRRLLVSEVQAAIDPRRRGAMLRRLAGAGQGTSSGAGVRDAAALGNALEARYPGLLTMPRDAAWVTRMQDMSKKLGR